jgi:hypothetical protein
MAYDFPFPLCGVNTIPGATQNAATVITQLFPPFSAGNGPNRIFQVNPAVNGPDGAAGADAWGTTSAYTHVMSLDYVTVTTAQTLYVIRPANWTYLTAAAVYAATTLTLAADPGIFSTNFKYSLAAPPTGGASLGSPSAVADAGIASGDWVALQLKDGTWFYSAVTSYSAPTLTITTALPTPTTHANGGAYLYSPVFLFKAVTVLDPNTGYKQPNWITTVASPTPNRETFPPAGNNFPLVSSLHKGDPLLFYSANATTAGFLGLTRLGYAREVGRGN